MTNGPQAGEPMIEIRNLHKTYRVGEIDVHALRGVNLSVARGEFLSVIGPSGSGKSTLFHILGGLTPGVSRITNRDLAALIASVSDNAAMNVLMDRVGMENVNALLDPLLRPIRRIMPDTGMIDVPPATVTLNPRWPSTMRARQPMSLIDATA